LLFFAGCGILFFASEMAGQWPDLFNGFLLFNFFYMSKKSIKSKGFVSITYPDGKSEQIKTKDYFAQVNPELTSEELNGLFGDDEIGQSLLSAVNPVTAKAPKEIKPLELWISKEYKYKNEDIPKQLATSKQKFIVFQLQQKMNTALRRLDKPTFKLTWEDVKTSIKPDTTIGELSNYINSLAVKYNELAVKANELLVK
jgi:hypothetical protein